jgi:LacI family transcriptional regulator
VILDERRGDPLHLQLRQSLRGIISRNFEDRDLFYPEEFLVAELGISRGTVRRALGDLASEGLLKRWPAKGTIVCKPNPVTSLANIAVFLPEWSSELIAQYLDQIGHRIAGLGGQMILCHMVRGEPSRSAYRRLNFSSSEGAVLLLSNPPEIMRDIHPALVERGYFTVTIDTLLEGFPGHYVGVDNGSGIRQAMEHLVGLGHRRIALIASEPRDSLNVVERIAAFEKFCVERGLGEAWVHQCGTKRWESSQEKAGQAMEALWNRPDRPTAILAISDASALGVIRWLTQRRVRIPEEVSVMGFDGENTGARIHPALSTVAQPFGKITDTVFRLLAERPATPQKIFHPPSLLARESAGPVPVLREIADPIKSRS